MPAMIASSSSPSPAATCRAEDVGRRAGPRRPLPTLRGPGRRDRRASPTRCGVDLVAPPRPRDFRLSSADAERLRGQRPDRLAAPPGQPAAPGAPAARRRRDGHRPAARGHDGGPARLLPAPARRRRPVHGRVRHRRRRRPRRGRWRRRRRAAAEVGARQPGAAAGRQRRCRAAEPGHRRLRPTPRPRPTPVELATASPPVDPVVPVGAGLRHRRRPAAHRPARGAARDEGSAPPLTRLRPATPGTLAGVERLMLLDANSLIYRAYFALFNTPLTTSKGQLVNAAFGFWSIVLRGFQDVQPDYVIACFDLPAAPSAHEPFADYKATRRPTPDDLRDQFPIVRETLAAFRHPDLRAGGLRGGRPHRHARAPGRGATASRRSSCRATWTCSSWSASGRRS